MNTDPTLTLIQLISTTHLITLMSSLKDFLSMKVMLTATITITVYIQYI